MNKKDALSKLEIKAIKLAHIIRDVTELDDLRKDYTPEIVEAEQRAAEEIQQKLIERFGDLLELKHKGFNYQSFKSEVDDSGDDSDENPTRDNTYNYDKIYAGTVPDPANPYK